MIKFECGSCGKSLRVADDHAGKRGKCPQCQAVVTVPIPSIDLSDEPVGTPMGRAEADGTSGEQCPICGTTNTMNLRNCSGCGRLMRTRRGPVASVSPESAPSLTAGMGGRCPSCSRPLDTGVTICVACGIRVPSGRPLLVKRDIDEEALETRAETLIKPFSWLVRFGLYPISSEAGGRSRPYVAYGLVILTIVISVWFWIADSGGGPKWVQNLMLWPNEEGSITIVDYDEFREIILEEYPYGVSEEEIRQGYRVARRRFANAGGYHHYQLVTHAFLHGDFFHLLGNMIFLLVFGRAINAALGNTGSLVVYLLLAVLAAWVHLQSVPDTSIIPMVGASGALMGLAGMCVVLFPIHRIYMLAWLRIGFHTGVKVFPVWSLLVVGFYIAFDVIYTAAKIEDNVAHWAHLGGFMAGAGVAVLLLAARAVYTSGDIFSLTLGRHAWLLTGRPVGRAHKKGFWGLW